MRDVVTLGDGVVEDTFDKNAMTETATSAFGEDSKEPRTGRSPTAPVRGNLASTALPGVIMWADPAAQIGEAYYLEFCKGEVENKAKVVRLGDTINAAAGILEDVLVIREWNP